MAYETIQGGQFIKLGGVSKATGEPFPTSIEGYYKGSRTVATSNGPATVHDFATDGGDKTIWGALDMDGKLSAVVPGTMTLVEFTGKEKLKGGKTKNCFTVKVDRSNTTDISSVEYDDADEETPFDEANTSLATEIAARKAKVDALLKSKRSSKN